MKFHRLIFLLILILSSCENERVTTDSFFTMLDSKEGVRLEKLMESSVFDLKGMFRITQELDEQHPEAGTFEQRVMIAHRGFDRPTLFLTEGYEMRDSYFGVESHLNELSQRLDLNVVYAEHRYYGESIVPNDPQYTYLTVRNSANDLHRIYKLLKPYYKKKWASSGSSKNGMTAMYYQLHYPDDMDIAVPLVSPMLRSKADTRFNPYVRTQIGTPEKHKEIDDYIVDMLSRRSEMLPKLEAELVLYPEYSFKFSVDELFDLMLIDFATAKFQYARYMSNRIPKPGEDADIMINELLETSSIGYFGYSPNSPYTTSYNIQCAKELGTYLFDWFPETKERIKGLAVYQADEEYVNKYLVPEGLNLVYDGGKMTRRVEEFYLKNDPNVVFIYSKQDPYTAMGITDPSYYEGKKNMHLFIHPGSDHHIEIKEFPQCEEIYSIIQEALN